MYAIGPAARKTTETAGRIALGIKENKLSPEAVKAYESVRYIMFHYWKNSEAKPFKLTAPTRLVERQDIPKGFLIRQVKKAKQFLLLEYNPNQPADFGMVDILKTQRKNPMHKKEKFSQKLEEKLQLQLKPAGRTQKQTENLKI